MPEALLATTPILGDLGLGSLLGLGGGAAAAGAGAADAGAALAGPTVLGTVADTLAAPSLDALSGGALFGTGADVASTIGSSLAFPGLVGGAGAGAADILGAGAAASGADAAASTAASTGLASGVGSIPSATAPMDAFLAATPAAGAGTAATPAISTLSSAPSPATTGTAPSVFDTGTTPVPGLANTGTGYVPAGAGTGSAGVSAPASVATVPDPTAAAAGATPAGASAAPAAAPSSSISQLLSKLSPSNLGSDLMGAITKNPITTALGAAGLGYNILEGQKQTANEKALQGDAATATSNSNQMVASGEALQQYLTSGTLPPQYMQQVDQAIQSAKEAAISNAAAQGLPTDPTKNTALAATLAGIDNQRAGMISQVASQLFSSGSSLVSAGQSAAGLSGQLYQALVSNDTTQAGNIGKAISSLAAALNGKSTANVGGLTVTV